MSKAGQAAGRDIEPAPGERYDEVRWTTREAARFLKVSEVTVRRHANAGSLPHQRVGRLMRFAPDVVRSWSAPKQSSQAALEWFDQIRSLDPYATTQ